MKNRYFAPKSGGILVPKKERYVQPAKGSKLNSNTQTYE
jgi:hypothetical protein